MGQSNLWIYTSYSVDTKLKTYSTDYNGIANDLLSIEIARHDSFLYLFASRPFTTLGFSRALDVPVTTINPTRSVPQI